MEDSKFTFVSKEEMSEDFIKETFIYLVKVYSCKLKDEPFKVPEKLRAELAKYGYKYRDLIPASMLPNNPESVGPYLSLSPIEEKPGIKSTIVYYDIGQMTFSPPTTDFQKACPHEHLMTIEKAHGASMTTSKICLTCHALVDLATFTTPEPSKANLEEGSLASKITVGLLVGLAAVFAWFLSKTI